MVFISNLVSGLRLGAIYAVIALGYTMVYGIAKMLNFAHGDVIMIGAYAAFIALYNLGLSLPFAIILSILVCTLLGVVIERLAYKPLRQSGSLAVLITAIGVSYFLQNFALIVWGSSAKIFPTILDLGSISLFNGELNISYQMIISILVCILIMVFLNIFVKKTKIGKAMRACSEDKDAARLMGINVDNVISLTFAIGSGLAAVASILLCATYPTVTPTLGSMPGIKAFTAAVIGGIGSIPGALLGGLLLGVVEILVKAYGLSELSDAVTFAVLILVLLFKPAGLLGKKVREKV